MKTRLKKYLFWGTFPIAAVVAILTSAMVALGEWLDDLLDEYEGWCLEYRKHGWYRTENKVWMWKDPEENNNG